MLFPNSFRSRVAVCRIETRVWQAIPYTPHCKITHCGVVESTYTNVSKFPSIFRKTYASKHEQATVFLESLLMFEF